MPRLSLALLEIANLTPALVVADRCTKAAVQAAVAAGEETVRKLEGKLILADVITRPHPELAALLPA